MKATLWYVVIRGSKDKEFVAGDHVMLRADGSFACREMPGWILAEDVPAATRGMEVKLDLEWIKKRRAELESALASLRDAEKGGDAAESFGGKEKKARKRKVSARRRAS